MMSLSLGNSKAQQNHQTSCVPQRLHFQAHHNRCITAILSPGACIFENAFQNRSACIL